MLYKINEFLVTGLYVGKIKWAPGTFGTLFAVPLAWVFTRAGLINYMILTLIMIMVAIVLCQFHEYKAQKHDQGEVVIDEVVGYLLAFMWLPANVYSFVFSFLLFRLFDILKPFPISYIDKNIKGGLGVVADDLAAGLVTNLILHVVQQNTHWW